MRPDTPDVATTKIRPPARLKIFFQPTSAIVATDPPPMKWSDLRYVSDIKEDSNAKEAIQA